MTVIYDEYLRSEAWAVQRKAALERAGHACQTCSSKEHLEVHHRTYARLGNELPQDLTVLCSECHGLFHQAQKDERRRANRERVIRWAEVHLKGWREMNFIRVLELYEDRP